MSATAKRSALKHRSSHIGDGPAPGASATASSSSSQDHHDSNSNNSSGDARSTAVPTTTATTQEPANDGAQDTITVLAHVREKIVAVHCGFGTQQVVWLGHVAIARYDDDDGDDAEHQGWLALGTPTAITKASSSSSKRDALRFTDLICDVLVDGAHVYIETSLRG